MNTNPQRDDRVNRKPPTLSVARARTKKPAGPQLLQSDAPPPVPSPVSPSRTPAEQGLIDGWQQRGQMIPRVAMRETASGREVGSPDGDPTLWAARLAHVLQTDSPELLVHLLRQVGSCVWKTDVEEATNLTVAAVVGIAPRDPIETFLAIQMTATHNTGMEFLRRTMLPDQSAEGITEGVRRATQLLRLFATQTETLLRYRGGGKQSIVVQHVQVDGVQAIVANVQKTPAQKEGGEGDETSK